MPGQDALPLLQQGAVVAGIYAFLRCKMGRFRHDGEQLRPESALVYAWFASWSLFA
jgi:hypothetical protein